MTQVSDAEFVIIGGGAIGCGVAYTLARAGVTDILLVERAADVAQVTTAQGAGLCGQPRSTLERTLLAMHSVATFRELQRDPKVQPEWHETGSLRIALSEKRVAELRQLKSVADRAKLEAELIDNGAARKLWPAMVSLGRLHAALRRGEFLRLSMPQDGCAHRDEHHRRGDSDP
jgi:glycine/D-amino acid oxidase-like deaminating enzyme